MAKKAPRPRPAGNPPPAAVPAVTEAGTAVVKRPAARQKSFILLSIEAFVALSLVIYFFFLVAPQDEAPRSYDGSEMNLFLFTYLAPHGYVPKSDILAGFDNWRARLAGPMMTASLYETVRKDLVKRKGPNGFNSTKVVFGGYRYSMMTIIFGFYHAIWLLLLFLVLILYRRDALMIMLGVFAGLMYNFIVPAGKWFYPWDMPTMFFFTWACLLYDQRRFLPLLIVVWLGSLFKETTLCCALLVLLADYLPWKKRIIGFAAVALVCLVTRKLLMAAYGVHTMFFALNNTASIHDLISKTWTVLTDNIHLLFSPILNHVLFANAGAFLVMMLIPWRTRRDMVFKILAVAFIIGQFLCGIIIEFRIWYEILPLGWMLVSETLSSRHLLVQETQAAPRRPVAVPAANPPIKRMSQLAYWLMLGGLLTLAGGLWVVAKLHPVEPPEPAPVAAASAPATNGQALKITDVPTPEKWTPELHARVGLALELEASGKYAAAVQQYREVLRQDTNNATAMNNLAWNLVVNLKPEPREVDEALRLAARSVELTAHRQPNCLGTLGAVYAEKGQFGQAITLTKQAIEVASALGDKDVAKKEEYFLKLFTAGKTAGSVIRP